tara:strand:+ start:2148 stop:2591 length:444 start_codon:yes stop_codon:yes gene_type:complete
VEKILSELLKAKDSRIIDVTPDTKVEEAAKKMTEARVGALLVRCDGKLLGILTERDVLNKVVAQGQRPDEVEVHTIMTKDVIVIDPGRTVREAMQIVTEKKLRHLPVMKGDKLIGMVSGGDLTRSIVAEEEGFIDTLYDYIRGSYPG